MLSFSLLSSGIPVLIETLWNVNKAEKTSAKATESINRNIVECKCIRESITMRVLRGINRNIVECKFR